MTPQTRIRLSISLTLATACSNANAQRDPDHDPWLLMSQGRYLEGLAQAERDAALADPEPWAADVLATLLAAVGEHAGAKQAMGEDPDAAALPETSPLDGAERLDAIAAIVAEARERQVVIINEAHHVPQTRPLTLALAQALWDEGYRYLACEAFSPQITRYDERGYPTFDVCGGYLQEPVYADLVRVAAELGYRLIPYETEELGGSGDQVDRINARETAQCRNLMERIFEDDPDARVLVHCGYSHATEDWRTAADGREVAWMAARLGRALGTDPLTVDQTRQRQGATPDAGPPIWRYAVAADLLATPSVFRQEDGDYVVEGNGWAGRVDMQVFHPAVQMEHGRPTWMTMGGRRGPCEIPDALLPPDRRVLVQAFVEAEGEDAIPIDQVLWSGDGDPPALLLPRGSFRLRAVDDQGEVVATASCERAND